MASEEAKANNNSSLQAQQTAPELKKAIAQREAEVAAMQAQVDAMQAKVDADRLSNDRNKQAKPSQEEKKKENKNNDEQDTTNKKNEDPESNSAANKHPLIAMIEEMLKRIKERKEEIAAMRKKLIEKIQDSFKKGPSNKEKKDQKEPPTTDLKTGSQEQGPPLAPPSDSVTGKPTKFSGTQEAAQLDNALLNKKSQETPTSDIPQEKDLDAQNAAAPPPNPIAPG